MARKPRALTLRTGSDLAAAGLIAPSAAAAADRVAAHYSVAVPQALAALIDAADPDDPIARQFIPDPGELDPADGELDDPIGDSAHAPVPGLVHRYPDRVLLMPTLACPLYCRFCFRRDRVGGAEGAPTPTELKEAIDYIAARPAIREAILTGGDPLSLSDRRLGDILGRLAAIPHLVNIRLHTRAPIGIPERVTPDLIAALSADKPVWLSIHCNHPRELSPAVREALDRLARAGVPLISQTVLLKGVNDSVATLSELMRALVACRVRPYYLHHPDRAPGTARFRLTLDEGRRLVAALQGQLSGLCRPTYVVDIPGGYGKVPVTPDRAERAPGGWVLTDRGGARHFYPDGPPAAPETAPADDCSGKGKRLGSAAF